MKRVYELGLSGWIAALALTGCAPPVKDAEAPEAMGADGPSDPPGGAALDVKSTDEAEPSDDTPKSEEESDPAAVAESKPVGQAATTDGKLTGKLTQSEILALVTQHNELFNDCYTIGAGDSQQFVATVTVMATIGPSGRVAAAEIVKSTAKNAKVDDCVVTAFKKMPFPKPADGATSVITFPMKFEGAEEIQ